MIECGNGIKNSAFLEFARKVARARFSCADFFEEVAEPDEGDNTFELNT